MSDSFAGRDHHAVPNRALNFSTRVYVRVDSHNFGEIDVTPAVKGFNYEKSTTESGALSLSLAPYREWRDMLAANDLINIYVNLQGPRNDSPYNVGWVRMFFGYINDVRSNEGTDDQGVFTITFDVSCSDYQKAFERSEIYNHPYLRGDEVFGANMQGTYLMRMGAADQGPPRFLVMNHTAALLGFGKQWALPPHYREELPALISSSPVSQFFAERRIKNDALAVVQQLRKLAENYALLFTTDLLDRIQVAMKALTYSDADALERLSSFFDGNANLASRVALARQGKAVTYEDLPEIRLSLVLSSVRDAAPAEGSPVQLSIDPTAPRTLAQGLYDILCFDYLEYADGFMLNPTIFEYQGALVDLLRRDSHDVLNELIFDLRPTIDFYGGNVQDGIGTDLEGGVAMVPCVILREKPYTTWPAGAVPHSEINSDVAEGQAIQNRLVDVSALRRVPGAKGKYESASSPDAKSKGGIPPLPGLSYPQIVDLGGATWLQEERVEDYGPVVGMNSESLYTNEGGDLRSMGLFNRGPHTLEQIEITSDDVTNAALGRGDQDLVTGIDFYPLDPIGDDVRFYNRDLSPQFRHLLIRRHGLRMMQRTSELAALISPANQGGSEDDVIDLGPSETGDPVLLPMKTVATSFSAFITLRIIILLDHWYQHNLEYLNGSITLRPFPGVRAGYKLIWKDRDLAFYVESVTQNWTFPNQMETTVRVTRGQPHSKPLGYVMPDDRVNPEKGESFKLGAQFPIADIDFEDPDTRRRRAVTPGSPGKYSPSIIWQNFRSSAAVGARNITVQYPDGVNRGGVESPIADPLEATPAQRRQKSEDPTTPGGSLPIA